MHSRRLSIIITFCSYLSVVLLVAAVVWGIGIYSLTVTELPPQNYNRYRCETASGLSDANHQLQVLDVFHLHDHQFADLLCANDTIARHFQSVSIVWQYRHKMDLRAVNDLQFELLIARDSLLQRASITGSDRYQPIVEFGSFPSYLVSFDEVPVMSNQFLKGKRLGLLEDTNSQSGYRIPRAALREAGVDESQYQTLYFKSHEDLLTALVSRQVDLIASASPTFSEQRVYKLLLQQAVPPPQAFIHPRLFATDVHCAINATLADYLQSERFSQYSPTLHTLQSCRP